MPIEILLLLKRTKDKFCYQTYPCVCVCGGWHMHVQTQWWRLWTSLQ